jgi:hypothetical protein
MKPANPLTTGEPVGVYEVTSTAPLSQQVNTASATHAPIRHRNGRCHGRTNSLKAPGGLTLELRQT